MILRESYLNKIRAYINKPVIKVITGMRRVGKSYYAKQIILELQKLNIINEQILYINKELLEFDKIQVYRHLTKFITEYYKNNNKPRYLFIDEVQEINQWEKAISSFFAEGIYDIYITGSNSNLLSSELSTYISGRYVEVNIYSLGFDVFQLFNKNEPQNRNDEFQLFLKFGGFQVIYNFSLNEEICFQYIFSLYNTILVKDVIGRNQIRNIRLFQDITKFVFINIGQVFSSNSISKYLKSQKKKPLEVIPFKTIFFISKVAL
ncbi:ATP-binding protein [Lentimicrobium sp. S6]|uniref:ATP-binding protein n=1 Tax=Lentimicrobium sp. S6 TaxID=2735872 RepID=UPI00352C4932